MMSLLRCFDPRPFFVITVIFLLMQPSESVSINCTFGSNESCNSSCYNVLPSNDIIYANIGDSFDIIVEHSELVSFDLYKESNGVFDIAVCNDSDICVIHNNTARFEIKSFQSCLAGSYEYRYNFAFENSSFCATPFTIDLNECGNRLNNFYPFGLEAQDTLFNISLNHSSDSIQNLSVLVNREVLLINTGDLVFDDNNCPQLFPLIPPPCAVQDTQYCGSVWYRVTNDTEVIQRFSDEVASVIEPISFSVTDVFIATWDHVGYCCSNNSERITFQFIYDRINGFIFLFLSFEIAQVERFSSDDASCTSVYGELTYRNHNIGRESNVGCPGVFAFGPVDTQEQLQCNISNYIEEVLYDSLNRCNQICTNTIGSFMCECNPGYQLNDDLMTCSDFDECADGIGCYNRYLFPFGDENGDVFSNLPDDGSISIQLNTDFVFHSTNYRTVFLNNNGDLSFNSPFEDYTPASFPISTALIAPFWTDLFRYPDSNVWYRVTTNNETIQRVSEDVASAFPELTTFLATEVLIVTWDNVGYHCSSEERVTFQCVLATNGVHSFIFFLYGDVNSSTCQDPPQVGINAGNNVDFISVDGSRTSSIFSVNRESNLGCPGVFVFQVNGDFQQPQAGMQCNLSNYGSNLNCTNTIGSFICECNTGYQLNDDLMTCSDINECNNNSTCDHRCTNTIGSFICECNPGYQLNDDLMTCSGTQTEIIIIGTTVPVCIVILLLVIILLLIILKRRRNQINSRAIEMDELYFTNVDQTDNEEREAYIQRFLQNSFGTACLGELSSHLISATRVKLIEKIGQGEFGIVYRGLLTHESDFNSVPQAVAAKTLKGEFTKSDVINIIQESFKMKDFDHLNVLPLLGVCLDLGDAPHILTPFMNEGSLLSYLKRERPNFTISENADEDIVLDTTKQLLSMCLQIANGMEYLSQKHFVHRDLAARNCMISSGGIIKVADFGLSEDIYLTHYYRQTSSVKLPIKWMSLESIIDGLFNEKTDVWSYGVVCWEIFSLGIMPYPGFSPGEVAELLNKGERLSKPRNSVCSQEIYSLMTSCWLKNPDERPCFSEVVEVLNSILEPLADYVDFTEFYTKNLNA